jgi:hypothetical protein
MAGEEPVDAAHQAIDDAPRAVAALVFERQPDRLLDANCRALVERLVASVKFLRHRAVVAAGSRMGSAIRLRC